MPSHETEDGRKISPHAIGQQRLTILRHRAWWENNPPMKGYHNHRQSPWPPMESGHLITYSASPRGWASSTAVGPVTNKVKVISYFQRINNKHIQVQHDIYISLTAIIWMPHDQHL